MKGLAPLFLGIFGTFAFSWVGLTVIPNWQIGHLNPQSDEEGTDIYPQPQSGMFERGGRVYVANGCVYCHSEQVRPEYAGADIDRGWGNRRSAPRDYIFERQVHPPVPRQVLAHRGQFKPLASRRCIRRRGTMCIFIRRAASTLIRTCRPTGSSMKSAASMSNVRQML